MTTDTRLNRRSFVAALATSMTAAASAQASDTEDISEHPDLLAMSDRLPGVLLEYRDARDRVKDIEKVWGPQWPTPDPDIVWYGAGSQQHKDILGRGVETQMAKGDFMRVQNIGTPEAFEASYLSHMNEAQRRSKFKSQRGMKAEINWAKASEARIEPARQYWAEVERIEKASGVREAQMALSASQATLLELVGKILTFEEQGAIGIGIKAEALAAFAELPKVVQSVNSQAPEWLAGLGATLRRST